MLINLSISATAFLASVAAVQPAASAVLGWTSDTHVGVVRWMGLEPPLQAIVAFPLMDLSFYYWHQLNHRIPLLWRFHNVHHIDPDLDVSTAFRFHVGEVALSAGFRVVQILVIGPSLWVYLMYEFVFQAATLFHHSNLRLPIRVERLLNRVVVTPRMHGIHHSEVRGENRSNYGVVFPWWDWIHRTLQLNIPQAEVTIGIAGYSNPEDNGIWRVLAMPFRRQRDYWTRPDRVPAERDRSRLNPKGSRLAD